MGSFSFLETGFFFTLAITFLLMLLLVYHFKQRLLTTEQKQDTMFEIINNLVHEFNTIKTNIALMNRPPTPYPFQNKNVQNELNETQFQQESLEINNSDIESLEDFDEDDEDDNISVEELSDTEDNTEDEIRHVEEVVEDNIEENMVEVNQELIEEKPDFNKMNLGSLKSYILKQGWVEDASKMKKTQILNLIKEHI